MKARPSDEEHRVSTPLELFFDLCFVVAVAQASARLHHALGEGHTGHAVLSYLMVFFAIWWAWMNFTWFASAFDTDDVPYRLTTLLQITGALILAAGVPQAFDRENYAVITLGYVVMRLALVGQWLRVARQEPRHRPAALRFALGITLVQIGWVGRLFLSGPWFTAATLLLVTAELVVPVWAERPSPMTYHREHIAERYGLFTLIVLGESVLSTSAAFQSAFDAGHDRARLIPLAAAGLVIVFSMWWIYFGYRSADRITSTARAFFWGYGHYLVFGAAGAVGAGLAVAADRVTGDAILGGRGAAFAVAIPVAVFVLATWVLHIGVRRDRLSMVAYPLAAVLVLIAPLLPGGLIVIAVVLALLVTTAIIASGPPAPGAITEQTIMN